MQEISVEGKVINITHGDKILFPLDNITKLDQELTLAPGNTVV